jgi:hypothetical protein
MMGVDRIYIYDNDIPTGSETERVILNYIKKGVVLKHAWRLPPKSEHTVSEWQLKIEWGSIRVRAWQSVRSFISKWDWDHRVRAFAPIGMPLLGDKVLLPISEAFDLHYYGQTVAYHDCLLRSVGRHRWMISIDLDEYVAPRRVRHLKAYLNYRSRRQLETKGMVLDHITIPNAFFAMPCQLDPNLRSKFKRAPSTGCLFGQSRIKPELQLPYPFYMTERTHPFPCGNRSKVIVDPLLIHNARTHVVHADVYNYLHAVRAPQLGFDTILRWWSKYRDYDASIKKRVLELIRTTFERPIESHDCSDPEGILLHHYRVPKHLIDDSRYHNCRPSELTNLQFDPSFVKRFGQALLDRMVC